MTVGVGDGGGPAAVRSCKHAESREEIFTIGDLLACWIVDRERSRFMTVSAVLNSSVGRQWQGKKLLTGGNLEEDQTDAGLQQI